jgi:diaminohydroxyphosphoribosylaminopyrimidine deaminase / 5-amino-6-(5-phosphoribosylamino)uracil reductase
VGNPNGKLTPLDELYLQRAYELAARAMASTPPNPPVGAVVVRDGRVVGEGYHRRAGDAHAEPQALLEAGAAARGATIYVSLEPCRHVGRTPPCTKALIEAGIVRVVAGTLDPADHGGAAELREHGVAVDVADDPAARRLIEIFAGSIVGSRPYVALKMAASLDGFVASRPDTRERLGSDEEQRFVRELRTAYDAVLVGARTVRVDDPALTVRPRHERARPYVRIVAGGDEIIARSSRVFSAHDGYDRTIVLATGARRERFDVLRDLAEVLYVGGSDAARLDLSAALGALRARGILSVLCEGGPSLGASLLAAGLVDRVYWAIAPRFLSGELAVPALAGSNLQSVTLHFDRVERIGPDVVISGVPSHPSTD